MINKIGLKFAKLTVISLAENRVLNNGKVVKQFNCICDCGLNVIVESSKLTGNFISKNKTKGCDSCFRKGLSERFSKHSKSRSSEYRSWSSMKARCYNINNDFYYNYGAEG